MEALTGLVRSYKGTKPSRTKGQVEKNIYTAIQFHLEGL
jgi:hypothetical protein